MLQVELVPKGSWGDNLRSRLPAKEWDRLRRESYKNANYVCEICGGSGLQQGYKYPLECHEIWQYDDQSHTQTLVRLISLCPRCHQVKHFGRTSAMGNSSLAYAHLMEVNNWTQSEAVAHVEAAFKLWARRSQFSWALDISVLDQKI